MMVISAFSPPNSASARASAVPFAGAARPDQAVADVAGRRTLQLADGVRLLVLGEIDGDQRFLAAEQRIGQGERR
ncbi:hypothetical protein CKQ90_32900, partial [Klebsiella pneumoniae]